LRRCSAARHLASPAWRNNPMTTSSIGKLQSAVMKGTLL
jgi:hypothetical protein